MPPGAVSRGNKHGVAVAEKTVAGIYRLAVSSHYMRLTGKCAHQHQQRGFRQVKISNKGVYCIEFITRENEDVGVTDVRLYGTGGGAGRLQRAHRRRPHGTHPAALFPGLFYRPTGRFVYLKILGVHHMIGNIIGANRLKCAGTHVQRNLCPADAFITQLLQQVFGKVKAGRRRGDGALSARKNSLVTILVGDFVLANKLAYGPHVPFLNVKLPGLAGEPAPGLQIEEVQ